MGLLLFAQVSKMFSPLPRLNPPPEGEGEGEGGGENANAEGSAEGARAIGTAAPPASAGSNLSAARPCGRSCLASAVERPCQVHGLNSSFRQQSGSVCTGWNDVLGFQPYGRVNGQSVWLPECAIAASDYRKRCRERAITIRMRRRFVWRI